MVLDITFTIFGCLIIISLIPLYIYRDKIYKKFARSTDDIKYFYKDTKNFLITNYPKINFDFNILDKFNNIKDINLKETLIAEEFAKQFATHPYELTTQAGVH